jgi:peptide/nickel transport system permease protein
VKPLSKPGALAGFVLRRLGILAATLLAASLLVFGVLELLPGNAAQALMGPDAAPEAVAALAEQLGLNDSAATRYGRWMGGLLLHGDAGQSAAYSTPVADLIAERLAVTVPLALMAFAAAAVLAVAAGSYAAAQHGKTGDALVMGLSQLGLALPNFWFAILLILLFSVGLRWLPSGGFPGWSDGAGPALRALLLPAVALAAVQAAILARVVRTAMLELLGDDFVRTARAKGLGPARVLWRHVLPNAAVPVLTVMGLQFANLLAGTVVIETVFTLPGLGRLIFQAIANRDLAVVRAGVLLLVAVVVLVNFVVDVLAAAADPRVALEAPDRGA